MDEITKTTVDVEKVEQLFDEILTFMLDERNEQDYARTRVELANEIFKLMQEVIELMYRTNLQFLSECTKAEAIDKLQMYKVAEDYLDIVQKDIDILQC